QWPMFQSGTRRYVFPTFPYSLVYFVENDTLNVVAVAHDKRKPGYWRNRLHEARGNPIRDDGLGRARINRAQGRGWRGLVADQDVRKLARSSGRVLAGLSRRSLVHEGPHPVLPRRR